MNEKRFKLHHINDLTDQEYMRLKKITDNGELITLGEVVDLLNEQQDQISYWKHKVSSLLWILGQFDEEKVKGLLKEMENE